MSDACSVYPNRCHGPLDCHLSGFLTHSFSPSFPALHSTQFKGPAPEEESLHVPAQRLTGPEWKHQRARQCGRQNTQQGNVLIKQ